MTFIKLPPPLLKLICAPLICLIFISCQGRENESKPDDLKAEKLSVVHATLQEEEKKVAVQIPAAFTADSVQQLENQLDSIFHYLHRKKGFNGTVLLTKYDQVIYKGAFGYADFYRKDTLSTETAFQLASVSKQFTAMAVMMLKEQGKLGYDDSVQQYIPEFPYNGITIRQLLTHRSGLANYTYFSDKLWPDRKLPMTNEDVLNLMATHQPEVYYQPDTHFDYSNTGYFLLASIVSKVSGIPFATFLQKKIFDPLQMTNTFTFSDSLETKKGKIATGHTGRRRKRTSDFLDTVLGDKGIYSTVEDLYKWDQALYTQKLVKKGTLEEAFNGNKNKSRKHEEYGFGWRIRPLESSGDTVVFHAGLWHGFNTYLLRNPKDHSALIVLSNLPNGSLKHVIKVQNFLYPAKEENSAPLKAVSDNEPLARAE